MSIKIYTTPTCPWCTRAKDYLRQRNVEFSEINVAADKMGAADMLRKSGQMGVPVLDINGRIIVGFDKEAIDSSLNL